MVFSWDLQLALIPGSLLMVSTVLLRYEYIKMSHHKDADMLILSEYPHVGHRMSSGLC